MVPSVLTKLVPFHRLRQSPVHDLYQRYLLPFKYQFIIPPLKYVQIEPTNGCNLKCPLCAAQNPHLLPARKKGYMDLDLFKKAVDEVATFKERLSLGLSFCGESLLHPRFADMLDYAASKNKFDIFFNTNGMLLDSRMIEVLCRLKIWRVVFSLDGLGAVHEAYRRGSNYDIVKTHIKALADRRGDEKAPQICVNMTQSNQTREEVRDFIAYWVQQVDRVEISAAVGEDMALMRPDFYDESTLEAIPYCLLPFYYLGVYWNGDITTCCADAPGLNVIGNLANQSLAEVWSGRSFKKFRSQILKNIPLPGSLCVGCKYWKYGFTPRTVQRDGLQVTYEGTTKIYRRLV